MLSAIITPSLTKYAARQSNRLEGFQFSNLYLRTCHTIDLDTESGRTLFCKKRHKIAEIYLLTSLSQINHPIDIHAMSIRVLKSAEKILFLENDCPVLCPFDIKAIITADKKFHQLDLNLFEFIQAVRLIRSVIPNISFETLDSSIESLEKKTGALLERNTQLLGFYKQLLDEPNQENLRRALLDRLRFGEIETIEKDSLEQLLNPPTPLHQIDQNIREMIPLFESKVTSFKEVESSIKWCKKHIDTFRQNVQKAGAALSDRDFSALIIQIFEHLYHFKDKGKHSLNLKERRFILSGLFVYWVKECQTPFIKELASRFIEAFESPSSIDPRRTIKDQLLNLKKDLNERIQDLFQILHEGQPFSPTQTFEKTMRASFLSQLNEVPKFTETLSRHQKKRIETLNEFSKNLDAYSKAATEDREKTLKEIERALSVSEAHFLKADKESLETFRNKRIKPFQFTRKDKEDLRALFQEILFWKPDWKGKRRFKTTLLEIQKEHIKNLQATLRDKQMNRVKLQKTALRELKNRLNSLYQSLLPKVEDLPPSRDLYERFAECHTLLEELDLIRQFIPSRATDNGRPLSPIFAADEAKLRHFFQSTLTQGSLF